MSLLSFVKLLLLFTCASLFVFGLLVLPVDPHTGILTRIPIDPTIGVLVMIIIGLLPLAFLSNFNRAAYVGMTVSITGISGIANVLLAFIECKVQLLGCVAFEKVFQPLPLFSYGAFIALGGILCWFVLSRKRAAAEPNL